MQNIEVILEALGQAIFERDCRIHTLEYEIKRIKENLKDKESLIQAEAGNYGGKKFSKEFED